MELLKLKYQTIANTMWLVYDSIYTLKSGPESYYDDFYNDFDLYELRNTIYEQHSPFLIEYKKLDNLYNQFTNEKMKLV